jgi:HSP20 family protein
MLVEDAIYRRALHHHHYDPGTQIHQPQGARTLKPRMDLHENSETNTMTAIFEIPGLRKEEMHLSVRNGRLTVSGEVGAPDLGDGDYIVRERARGYFNRTVNLPVGTKDADIKAIASNGLLIVTFPKATAEQAEQRIEVGDH